jgi:phosphopentomutase
LAGVDAPIGSYARLREKSAGKDTTIGHWELTGLVSDNPLPTYPEGFPPEVLEPFCQAVGRGVLCNKPYSGTDVIRDYGREHLETGKLIVYTSADSVFQIAAHQSIVPLETLYEYCEIARNLLVGKHGVGRVIARPFEGEYPNYVRSAGRHDYSLVPPKATLLDRMKDAGYDVLAVGKIKDIFAGSGVTEAFYTPNNQAGMAMTATLQKRDFNGLCFVNLVDFDMVFGHRRDAVGYANALSEFDAFLGEFLPAMQEDDLLMITADHGCDPGYTKTTDHTREYVPLLLYRKGMESKNFGTVYGFDAVAATIAAEFGVENVSGQVLGGN